MSTAQKLYPYGTKIPFTSNGKRRNGQYEWHDENCQIQDFGVKFYDGKPSRNIWCATHSQWAIEVPVKVTWTFEDGTEVVR